MVAGARKAKRKGPPCGGPFLECRSALASGDGRLGERLAKGLAVRVGRRDRRREATCGLFDNRAVDRAAAGNAGPLRRLPAHLAIAEELEEHLVEHVRLVGLT